MSPTLLGTHSPATVFQVLLLLLHHDRAEDSIAAIAVPIASAATQHETRKADEWPRCRPTREVHTFDPLVPRQSTAGLRASAARWWERWWGWWAAWKQQISQSPSQLWPPKQPESFCRIPKHPNPTTSQVAWRKNRGPLHIPQNMILLVQYKDPKPKHSPAIQNPEL